MNETIIQYKKNKFTPEAWNIIKYHLQGWIGEIHHCCGKAYEYLATLKPMSSECHRGKAGHHKHIFGLPKDEREHNLAIWKGILGDDYRYFADNNLEG